MVRYACASTSLEQSLRLRFIKFKVLDAFLAMLDIICVATMTMTYSPSRDAGQFLPGENY